MFCKHRNYGDLASSGGDENQGFYNTVFGVPKTWLVNSETLRVCVVKKCFSVGVIFLHNQRNFEDLQNKNEFSVITKLRGFVMVLKRGRIWNYWEWNWTH